MRDEERDVGELLKVESKLRSHDAHDVGVLEDSIKGEHFSKIISEGLKGRFGFVRHLH